MRKNRADGGLTFYDKKTQDMAGAIAAPFMNDGTKNAYSQALSYRIEKKQKGTDQYTLTLEVSKKYLNDPKRVYPVTIDPTITWTGSTEMADVYVCNGSAYKNTNFYDSSIVVMAAGKGSNGIFRTYMHFAGIAADIKGQYVESSKLTMYESAGCAAGQTVSVHRSLSSWVKTTLTWNNRPDITPRFADLTTTGTAKKAHTIDTTDYARNIANESEENGGILIKNADETDKTAKFYSSRYTTSTLRPKLTVVHYDGPETPTSVTVSNKYLNGTTALKVSWDGLVSKSLAKAQYRVAKCDDAGNVTDADFVPYRTLKTTTAPNGTVSIAASKDWGDGRYNIYVRGLDEGGITGKGKGTHFWIDSVKPKIASVTLSPTSTKASPANTKTPKLTWSGVTDKNLKEVQYAVDGADYVKAGEASGTITIKETAFQGSGDRTIKMRAVDLAGNISAEKTLTYYIDKVAPTIGKVWIQTAQAEELGDDWTKDENPIIHFRDVKEDDSAISASGVQYALVPAERPVPKASDYKNPVNLTIQKEGGAYQGTFYLTDKDKEKTSGKFGLYLRMKDTMGNTAVKMIPYSRDFDRPVGSIKVTLQGTGEETADMEDTVMITGQVDDGKGSGIKDSSLLLYALDQDGKETEAAPVYKEATISTTRPFDTSKLENGTYRLKLVAVDHMDNRSETIKDVRIVNKIKGPKVTAVAANKSPVQVAWNYKNMPDLKYIEYRLEGDTKWAAIDDSAKASGQFPVSLPDKEGTYKVLVRGVDSHDIPGEEVTVICIIDKTAPEIELTALKQGKLKGTVKDDRIKEWTVSTKEIDEDDTAYQQVLSGSKSIDKGSLGFIDLRDPRYLMEHQYVIKLDAVDIAGNESTCTFTITMDPNLPLAEKIKPDYRIKRLAYENYASDEFLVKTQATKLELNLPDNMILPSSGAAWYVDNLKVAQGPVYEDNFSGKKLGDKECRYTDGTVYSILAVTEGSDNQAKYSRTMTKNGGLEEVDLKRGTDGQYTKTVTLEDPAVSFRLKGSTETAEGQQLTYQIKTEEGSYRDITMDQTYRIDKLDGGAVTTDALIVRAMVSGEGKAEAIPPVTLILDTIEPEQFRLSDLENYRPDTVSIEDKVNYKTYIKWDLYGGTVPENISYEIYRGTEEDFVPSEDTLAAKDIQSGYWAEVNVNYSKHFYYRICAVKKNEKGEVVQRSSYSDEVFSRVIDSNEYTKRMGIKEYWQYAEFATPNGTGQIEKSDGNFVYDQVDADLPNEKLDVSLSRTYNSQSSAKSAFGIGWSHGFDLEIINICQDDSLDFKNVVFKDESGTMFHFTGQKDGSYISSMGKYMNLVKEDRTEEVILPQRKIGTVSGDEDKKTVTVTSAYTITTKDNLEYRFNSGGQIVYMGEPNGNFLLFEYELQKGMLEKVTTSKNLAMEFEYNSEKSGQDPLTVKQVNLPDGSSFAYNYTGNVFTDNTRLTSVVHKGTDGQQITYKYDYDNSEIPNLNKIYDGEGNLYEIQYDREGDKVQRTIDPAGKQTQLTYSGDGEKTKIDTVVEGQVVATEENKFDGYFGNCVQHTDPAGVTTTYTYQNNLLLATLQMQDYQEVDPETGLVTFKEKEKKDTSQYDHQDNVTVEKDAAGEMTAYDYCGPEAGDILDDLVQSEVTVNGDGETTSDVSYEYDENGNELSSEDSITEEASSTVYYEDDEDGGLCGEPAQEIETVKDVAVSKTTYQYQYKEDGTKTETATEVTGDVTTVTTTVSDALGRELSVETRANGKLIQRIQNTYDGFGRLTKTRTTDGTIVSETASTYDNNGTVLSETDADGTKTTYAYDGLSRVKERTVSKGTLNKTWTTDYHYENITVRGIYDEAQSIKKAYVTTEKNPDGYITAQTFTDPLGRTVRERQNGCYTDMSYDKQGNTITQYSGGQLQAATEGKLTLHLYDANGNQSHTAINPAITEGSYDLGGDCIVTENKYDSSGNMIAGIDGNGNRMGYTYDIENQLTQVQQPGAVTTAFSYAKALPDGSSKVTTTDANGNKSSVTTNVRGLESEVTDYLSGDTKGISRTYAYDAQGNKIKETELSGNYKTFAYDGKSRLIQTDYFDKDQNKTLTTKYTYDMSDNMTLMEDYNVSDGQESLYRTTKYTYDSLKRLTGFAEWDGDQEPDSQVLEDRTTKYSYDIDGNLVEIDYPKTESQITGLEFTYTVDKWIHEVYAKTNKGRKLLRQYQYDLMGKVAGIKDYRTFMEDSSQAYIKRTYAYDDFDRVTEMAYTDSENPEEIKESYRYAYDKNNHIVSETVKNNYPQEEEDKEAYKKSYTYDELDRLIRSAIEGDGENDSTSYAYDPVGNRLKEQKEDEETTYAYNGLNQLISAKTQGSNEGTVETAADISYTYDKNGNQTGETDSVNKESKEMSYDADNRLNQYVRKTGEEVVLTQENRYNGEGQRISKKETAGNVSREKTYYYENGSVLYTGDQQGKTTSLNLMGTGGNVIATTRKGADNTESAYIYNKNIQESTTNLVSSDGQAAVSYEYDDFGQTTVKGDEGLNEICYTGGIYDQSTGLYYLNARYYNPQDGRFISQDTYRGEQTEPDTLHLYAYCANNPVNYVDPSGHKKVSISLKTKYRRSWASVSIKGEQKDLLCRYTKKLSFKAKAKGAHKIKYSVKKYYTNRYYPNTRNFNFKVKNWYNGIVFKILVGFYRGDNAQQVVLMRVNLFYKSNSNKEYYSKKNKILDDRAYDGTAGIIRLSAGIE